MSAYPLGLATLPALALVGWLALSVAAWVLWWCGERNMGQGYNHNHDRRQDGKWLRNTRHTHWWPPGTPWWVIRWAEPLRVWLCLRDPDRRRADAEGVGRDE